MKVNIILEIDPVLGLDRVSNTLHGVAAYAIESGLDNLDDCKPIYKLVDILPMDGEDLHAFYPHGTPYFSIKKSFKDDKDFMNWVENNPEEVDEIDRIMFGDNEEDNE